MKKLPLALASIFLLSALSGCGSAAQSTDSKSDQKQLVISTWGLNEDALQKDVFEPFEKANNVKIVLETGNNGERLTKLKNNPNSNVDIMYLAESFSEEGIQDGLFEKIDYSKVPNAKKVIPKAQKFITEGYGPAYTLNRAAIVYNPEKVNGNIASWKDLWSPDFKGKIAIPDITTTFGPAMVCAASKKDGVDVTSDKGVDAFKSLQALKPNVVKTYTKSSDLVNMFSNGEITAAVAADFVYGSIKKAVPSVKFVDPGEGAYLNFNTVNIVKSSKNKELALKFINYVLSAEVEQKTSKDVGESPVNSDVKLQGTETQGLTYGDEVEKSNVLDFKFINKNNKNWIDQWNKIYNN
ncbi:ABC transporter substrate-binding protein [Clostridium ljungdahlii]|uniref:Predicted ABC transporter, substrate-binding component n=1 Tax=Clostridium ljungdahlii (strain ATCC 55383 / DSM 13528 / PETC) TaxID=748727 RepID=D8GMN3_CLOLD|nr:ABC transporter substrate-binding protein [Clostridium ljungdahlii]ADK15671.1 predicted ABC transporter, substrate-binding component [Clostridium ljungdahlii DSM 13528]OAA86554.1 Putrescine-binding periplasmic protein precursor [Clostridium ljungdahlii DSM 13528]